MSFMDGPLCPFSGICQNCTKLEWFSYHKESAAAIPKTMTVGKKIATAKAEVFIVAVSLKDWRNYGAAHRSYRCI